MTELVRREDDNIVLPGLVTAHSHAFQRGLWGRTQALAASEDSFCSWRGGDSSPNVGALLESGVRICVGVDSQARSDAFEELRAIELDERVCAEGRALALEGAALLEAGTTHGAQAIGQAPST